MTDMLVRACVAGILLFGSADTVTRKVALATMPLFPFFLSQLSAIVYLAVYAALWGLSRRTSKQPQQSVFKLLSVWDFVWIGLADALGSLLGNIGAANIVGYQITLLAKLNIPFSALCSIWVLGKSFSRAQYVAMAMVISGGVMGLLPSILSSSSHQTSLLFAGVYVMSVLCTAVSIILKERVFMLAQRQGADLDVFCVLTLSNVFTLLFTFAFLPISSIPSLGLNVPLTDLPNYLADGFRCFGGRCQGCPAAPLVYMATNVLYNVCAQTLIKLGGTVLFLITNTITFPIASLAFLLPWPYLPASAFSIWIVLALVVEVSGVLIYRAYPIAQPQLPIDAADTQTLLPDHEAPLTDSGPEHDRE